MVRSGGVLWYTSFSFVSRKTDRFRTLTFRAQSCIVYARQIKEHDMSASVSRIVVTGLLFLFTLASGVWLSSAGKPYPTGIFTIHKLIALGAVISTVVTINHLRTGVDIQAFVVGVIVVAGVLFLALFVSGALLSIGKPEHVAILTIHRVAPFLAVIATAMTLYLLASGKP
jgi:hypothetical protein